MFMQLAGALLAASQPKKTFAQVAEFISRQTAGDLASLVEATWQQKSESFPVRDPAYARDAQENARRVLTGFQNTEIPLPEKTDHLIYAYMLENTRILEIFRRILVSFFNTENFNTPSAETLQWLDQTERLFFRDPGPLSVLAVTGELRPDADAVRRNAYHRLLGLDLNHGRGGKPGAYPYHRTDVTNQRFPVLFGQLLEEVSIGIQHAGNTSGANPTDDFRIQDLVQEIGDVMLDRRGPSQAGLAHEEFVAVTFLSWLHLAISWESPVVRDLRATASTPHERLRRLGARVKLDAHQDSRSFLQLGPDVSLLLYSIERRLEPTQQPEYFYTRGSQLRPVMDRIIHHWSHVTGTNVRSRATRLDPGTVRALGNASVIASSPASVGTGSAASGQGTAVHAARVGAKDPMPLR
ncbi:hypothetical protein ACFV1F_02540 [Streptomyces sp. NPDC059590]|uniref:hypothetical protein n=1 Tax=Streptomyces sp. NPDC059590 TaxID=3346877 RepID=UPI0036C916F8